MLLCIRDSVSFLPWSLKNCQCTILKLNFVLGDLLGKILWQKHKTQTEKWVSYLTVDHKLDALLGHGCISSTADWWVEVAIRASRRFLFVALGFLAQSLSIFQLYSCLACATRTDLLESFANGNPVYSNRSFVDSFVEAEERKCEFSLCFFLLYLLLSPCRKSKLPPQINLLPLVLTLWAPRVRQGEINKTCTRHFRLLAGSARHRDSVMFREYYLP